MTFEQKTRTRLKPLLDQHTNIKVEIGTRSFRTLLLNNHPNLLGNFPGGDMAYVANAAAGLICVNADCIAETASINIECLSRADGDALVADAIIIKKGRKLIRTRVDVYIRNEDHEKLVAIAQVNMSPLAESDIPDVINSPS